jgi:hypothetical protein
MHRPSRCLLFGSVLLRSPKLESKTHRAWYQYYAGYSPAFVEDALNRLGVSAESCVLDPWNGSGTTTAVASTLGVRSVGFDINPVLVIVGRGRLLAPDVLESVRPLACELVEIAKGIRSRPSPDPLESWLSRRSALSFRRLERSIRRALVDPDDAEVTLDYGQVSTLAAVYYTALFETLRDSLSSFVTSNPTWVRQRRRDERGVVVPSSTLISGFLRHVDRLAALLARADHDPAEASVEHATATQLPLETGSISTVLSSPPYLTRIDYVMATLPELALLGHAPTGDAVADLRSGSLGSPLTSKSAPDVESLPKDVRTLLRRISRHTSKASTTYYSRYYASYFTTMSQSLGELSRVAAPAATMSLVVQDSYYKEIHVDLPALVTSLVTSLGWAHTDQVDFGQQRTKAAINTRARKYRAETSAIESVLFFARTAPATQGHDGYHSG